MASHNNYQVARNKNTVNRMATDIVINNSKTHDNYTKSERLMNGVAEWASFYRARPDIFAKDYLGIDLKPFQVVLLYAMIHYNYTMFLARRGLGSPK